MFLGVPSPARKYRPQLVDLNLVPEEYRPRSFPFVTVGLAMLTLGSVILLYALFYAKTYTDLEITQLNLRVNQAQSVVQSATGDPAAIAHQEQLRAMRDDYQVLAQRQINWGDVIQTIGDVPPGVLLKSVNQAGFGVTVSGAAVSQAAAAQYLDQLRSSGLFVGASIQVAQSAQPLVVPGAAVVNPTPSPTLTPSSTPTAPTPRVLAIMPTPVPSIPPQQEPRRSAAPPLLSVPTTVPTRTPTLARTLTPTITMTPTITPTATPGYAFVLASSQQLPAQNPLAGTTDIRGTVVDTKGNPVSGVQLEIDSEGSPAWTFQSPLTGANGTFDFSVSHGKFDVFVTGTNSQVASDLYTGADGVPGVYNYQLKFQETFTGPSPTPNGSVSPSVTPTDTASPSQTPIAPGSNIASLGCATAYMVQNGTPKNLPSGTNPNLAIDGNLGTEWNAQLTPTSGTQVIWQWALPGPGPGEQVANCTAPGLADAQDQIVAFQLVPDQNPAGATYHELWLYSDTACTVNLSPSDTAWSVLQQDTAAGQVIPISISTEPVRCVILRTIQDPSYVAWEEVQIFQQLPPPQGFPSLTPTPSLTGTDSPTPGASGTPTNTAIPSGTATPTNTLTVTPTSLPPVAGENIAPYAGSIVLSNGSSVSCAGSPSATPTVTTNPCAAIDNNPSTYWAPTVNSTDPQGLTVNLASPQFYPASDTVNDVRVQVQSQGNGTTEIYQVSLNNGSSQVTCPSPTASTSYADSTQLDCPFATPVANVGSVSVVMFHGGTEDGTYGIREIQVFKEVASFGTNTPTVTTTATSTATPSPTATATSTNTTVPPTNTSASAPTTAPTLTSTYTPTSTSTFTPTSTNTTTPRPTSTASGTRTSTVIPATITPSSVPTVTGVPGAKNGAKAKVDPTATIDPTAKVDPTVKADPTSSTLGRGQGPGDTPTSVPLNKDSEQPSDLGVPTPTPTPSIVGAPSGPNQSVDFTIILEVGSGKGYP